MRIQLGSDKIAWKKNNKILQGFISKNYGNFDIRITFDIKKSWKKKRFCFRKHSNFQLILSKPSWILIIFYILLECKSKKVKNAIVELKNPYEQIFVRHPVCIMVIFGLVPGCPPLQCLWYYPMLRTKRIFTFKPSPKFNHNHYSHFQIWFYLFYLKSKFYCTYTEFFTPKYLWEPLLLSWLLSYIKSHLT